MRSSNFSLTKARESSLSTNRVLRNTYFLLSLTLLFSSAAAGYAMMTNAAPVGILWFIIGYFGLYFLTLKLRNSSWGLVSIFALTGFLGYTVGPIVNFYIKNFSNGSQLVLTALATTGLIFLALSTYVLTTRKNFSYLAGFLFIAVITAFVGSIAAILFHLPMLQLIVSCAFALIASGYILFMTSEIIHGGEQNYIVATVVLYISLFSLFINLLNIFGALGGNRN